MDTLRPNWCLIFVVALVLIAGFGGMGSAQQTPTATANTTTTTGGQDTQAANGTATGVRTSTRASTTTPDANDEWEDATPIDTGQPVNGTLPVGDQDWHVFSPESSGRITVRLVAADQTDMSGFLYNSAGDLLDSSYVAPGEQISLTGQASSAGEYYVFARNEANNTPGAYAFEVAVSESEAVSGENAPQTEAESSSSSGPGFGLLAGLASIAVAGYLFVRATANS